MSVDEIAQCRILLKKLKDASSNGTKGGSLAAPELRQLREGFKAASLAALQLEYEQAQKDDIERRLWRYAFYMPIAEFRNRLSASNMGEQLRAKTLAVYLTFLEDSENFYSKLVTHFQHQLKAILSTTTTANKMALRASISRCFICIGDLRRYYTTTAANTTTTSSDTTTTTEEFPDYSSAREAYAAAAAADPSSGNAYNQMAVVDEAQKDELAAAYFYLRAKHAEQPFAIGHQNAALLFGGLMFGAAVQPPDPTTTVNGGRIASKLHKKQRRGRDGGGVGKMAPPQQAKTVDVLEKDIASKYLAIYGSLFEKIDLDATAARLTTAAIDLDELLHRMKQRSNSGGVGGASRRIARALATAPTTVEAALSQRPLPIMSLLILVPMLVLHGWQMQQQQQSSTVDVAVVAAQGYATYTILHLINKFASTAVDLRFAGGGGGNGRGGGGKKGGGAGSSSTAAAAADAMVVVDAAVLSCPILPALLIGLRWLCAQNGQSALPSGRQGQRKSVHGDSLVVESSIEKLLQTKAAVWRRLTALCGALAKCRAVQLRYKNNNNITADVDMQGRDAEGKGSSLIPPEDLLLVQFPPLMRQQHDGNDDIKMAVEGNEKEEEALPSSDIDNDLVVDPGDDAGGAARVNQIWDALQTLAGDARVWLEEEQQCCSSAATTFDGGEESEAEKKAVEAVAGFVEAAAVAAAGAVGGKKANIVSNQPVKNVRHAGGGAAAAAAAAAVVVHQPRSEEERERDRAAEEGYPMQNEAEHYEEEEEEEEHEEEIVFAPLHNTVRRTSSAALLRSAGASPAPPPPPPLPPQQQQQQQQQLPTEGLAPFSWTAAPQPATAAAAAAAMDIDAYHHHQSHHQQRANAHYQMNTTPVGYNTTSNNNAAAAAGGTVDDVQAAMERTGHEMAAQVLSFDDVNGDHQDPHSFSTGQPLPPTTTTPTTTSLFGEYGVSAPNNAFFNPNSGNSTDSLFGSGGGGAPIPSWLTNGGGGTAPLQHNHHYAYQHVAAPPLPSTALQMGSGELQQQQQQQQPADGLRALLFGGGGATAINGAGGWWPPPPPSV